MFECKYCAAKFIRESAYVKHRCSEMDRFERAKTPMGQMAFQIYCKWMRANRRVPIDHEKFYSSPVFNPLFNFAEFAKKAGIVIDVFVEVVTRIDLHPSHWKKDEAYALYLEHIERAQDPEDWMKTTIKLLIKYADALDCDVAEVIELLKPNEMLDLVRKRQLSPWILLHSSVFKRWLLKQDKDDQARLQELVRPVYWSVRFSRDSRAVARAKKYVRAAGL